MFLDLVKREGGREAGRILLRYTVYMAEEMKRLGTKVGCDVIGKDG